MADAILKGCVKEVRSYAQSIGHELTQSQAYEIVARARGFHSANVLAAQNQPVNQHKISQALSIPSTSGEVILSAKSEVPADAEILKLTKDDLLRLHVLEIGKTLLDENYLRDVMTNAHFSKNRPIVSLIVPISIESTPTAKTVSELLFGHSDVLINCKIRAANYPFGKYYKAYHVIGYPWSFDLPLSESGDRLGKSQTLQGAIDNAGYLMCSKVGFGYSELDWCIGNSNHASRSNDDSVESISITRRTDGKTLNLSIAELSSLKHLVGCYYEVTQGVHEGMRVAFYY